MKQSLKGHLLPESEQEFADNFIDMKLVSCLRCSEGFGPNNVFTPAGWKETQISGFCETCFDKLLEDDDETP